uniref:RAD51 interacting motif domain-containing protein n=1 Tax=Plectus sambesii TaxID=2011161 RepID=A0A914URR7_9BILA
MSRRCQRPVDYASMVMDFSDDEDFIVSKKKAAEKEKAKKSRAEKADKRRSKEDSPESSKNPKKRKTTTPKKNGPKAANIDKDDVIKLDSDESNHATTEPAATITPPPPPLKEANTLNFTDVAAISSSVSVEPQNDDHETHTEEKESSGFVSATKVMEDEEYVPPSQESDGDENNSVKKTPKVIASSKVKSEQKGTDSFKVVPQVSDRLKSLSKWTPPGPLGSIHSPSVATTPSSGLRMGLSRNSRPKPLHQPPKIP